MKRFFISLCTTLLLLAMVEPVAAENITFAAPNVKALSVTNLSTDGDEELSYPTLELGSYVYTSTQRFKVIGENLVMYSVFDNGLDGWYGSDKETMPDAEVWGFVENAGPSGEKVLQSLGATAQKPLCNSWTMDAGTYIVSFDIKSPTSGAITIGKNLSISDNYADFFLNSDGNFNKVNSTEEAPVVNVAVQSSFPAGTWKKIVFPFTAEQGQNLVMHFEKLATGIQITNIDQGDGSTDHFFMISRTVPLIIKLRLVAEFVDVADLCGQNVIDMLTSGWKDYEDATQYRSAVDEEADCIVTRNKKDFKASTIPVLTAAEFFEQMESK